MVREVFAEGSLDYILQSCRVLSFQRNPKANNYGTDTVAYQPYKTMESTSPMTQKLVMARPIPIKMEKKQPS